MAQGNKAAAGTGLVRSPLSPPDPTQSRQIVPNRAILSCVIPQRTQPRNRATDQRGWSNLATHLSPVTLSKVDRSAPPIPRPLNPVVPNRAKSCQIAPNRAILSWVIPQRTQPSNRSTDQRDWSNLATHPFRSPIPRPLKPIVPNRAQSCQIVLLLSSHP
jgi:hypothetical protein